MPMPKQPAPASSGYWLNENYTHSSKDLTITTVRTKDTLGKADTIIINHWKDTAWIAYPKLFLKDHPSYYLMRSKDRIFLAGRFKQFNNNIAPSGYSYTLLEMRNGIWDSVPGGLDHDTINHFYAYTTTEDGIYKLKIHWVKNTFNQYSHIEGNVTFYDTVNGTFDSVANFISYGSNLRIKGGTNRLLISCIDSINGQKTHGFAYIEGGVTYRNTDSRFPAGHQYYIDPVDDHIYLIPYSGSSPILEYSNQFVSSRQTSKSTYTTGGAGVYDGKIVYVTYDDDYNQHINVLCKNETQWKTIVRLSLTSSNQIFTNSGFYYYDYTRKKVMVLDEGSLIQGYAFIDLDSNCVRDTVNEPLVKDQIIMASSKDYKVGALTDSKGRYELFVTPATYKLSGPARTANCGPDTMVITGIGSDSTMNLPMIKPGFHDMKARLMNGFITRWNSIPTYEALIENVGEPYDSAYVEFNVDGKLDLRTLPNGFSAVSGNRVGGVLRNLGYFDKRRLFLSAWVDTATTKPDSIVCTDLLAYLYTSDKDSSNNTDTVCQKVVYSYDPNYISCSRDTIPVNVSSKLEYMIEFQNEGNDDAYDVVITDLLPSALSMETFEIIGASHPYTIAVEDNRLVITFKDIFLKPKKTDEAKSKGYFKYAISTKPGLKNWTLIKNTAYIYFDLNKPVITNTNVVFVSDGSPITSISQPSVSKKGTLSAYPNPVKSELTISSDIEGDIFVYGLDGKLFTTLTPESGSATIDISEWPDGIYLVRCGAEYCKVVKQSW
jgi:uncharacterized repeat protein (TIGR01451 family)